MTDEIYDCLEKVGLVGSPEHQVQLDTLKGQNPVCKFHSSNSHATADCVAFRHAIQDKEDWWRLAEVSRKGREKRSWLTSNHFPRRRKQRRAGVYSWPLRRKPRIRRWTYGLHRRLISCPKSLWSLQQGNGCGPVTQEPSSAVIEEIVDHQTDDLNVNMVTIPPR